MIFDTGQEVLPHLHGALEVAVLQRRRLLQAGHDRRMVPRKLLRLRHTRRVGKMCSNRVYGGPIRGP